jgi:hypothetical protein
MTRDEGENPMLTAGENSLPPGGCVTMTVFDSFPTGGPVYSNLICADNWAATSIYRNLGAEVSPTSSASSARSTSRLVAALRDTLA